MAVLASRMRRHCGGRRDVRRRGNGTAHRGEEHRPRWARSCENTSLHWRDLELAWRDLEVARAPQGSERESRNLTRPSLAFAYAPRDERHPPRRQEAR